METYEKIKKLRENRGFTQKEVADALNINISVYKKIELGSRPIRENELAMVADFFNVSADYLLNRTSDPSAPTDSDESVGNNILSHFKLNTADMEVEDIQELEEEINEYMEFLIQRAKAKKNKKWFWRAFVLDCIYDGLYYEVSDLANDIANKAAKHLSKKVEYVRCSDIEQYMTEVENIEFIDYKFKNNLNKVLLRSISKVQDEFIVTTNKNLSDEHKNFTKRLLARRFW